MFYVKPRTQYMYTWSTFKIRSSGTESQDQKNCHGIYKIKTKFKTDTNRPKLILT